MLKKSNQWFFVDDIGAYSSMLLQIMLMIGTPLLAIFGSGLMIAHYGLIDTIIDNHVIYWALSICLVLGALAGATKHQGDITIGLIVVMLAIGFGPFVATYL